MKKNFWNNKKVFITGHTGFKGSWLTLWLKKLGADVKFKLVKFEIFSINWIANSLGAFTPVPTAVPPWQSSWRLFCKVLR